MENPNLLFTVDEHVRVDVLATEPMLMMLPPFAPKLIHRSLTAEDEPENIGDRTASENDLPLGFGREEFVSTRVLGCMSKRPNVWFVSAERRRSAFSARCLWTRPIKRIV